MQQVKITHSFAQSVSNLLHPLYHFKLVCVVLHMAVKEFFETHFLFFFFLQHSLSNLYYTLLFVLSPSPTYKLQRGCVAEILLSLCLFRLDCSGTAKPTIKAQPSPLHNVFRNLKLTLSIFLSIVINLSLDKLEFHRFHSLTTVQ